MKGGSVLRRKTVVRGVLYLGLITLTVLQGIAGASSPGAKTTSDYWKDVGLSFSATESILEGQGISQGSCYWNSKRFVACVQALSVLAQAGTQPLTLITKEQYRKGAPEWGAIVKSFGPLALVQYDSKKSEKLESETFQQMWTRSRAKLAESLQSLEKVYQARARSRVNFKALISFLRQQTITPDNESVLTATVINTYLRSAVDPHTYIMPRKKVVDSMKATSQTISGIGAIFNIVSGKIIVGQLIEDGPAHRAGVHVRDVVLTVNGESVEGFTQEDISKVVRGPNGTIFNMTFLRDGEEVSVYLVRAPVIQAKLTSRMLNDRGIPVGYIKLQTFNEDTICERMAEIIEELEANGARGLILDLRGNAGGATNQAVCVGGLFIGKGKTIVRVTDLLLKNRVTHRSQHEKVTKLPMVTLINARSASASEAVAGALQDYVRSWIAGDRSFGKATVQSAVEWKPGVVLYRTVERFYQPTGRTNQIEGITPDFPLDPKPDATEDDRFAIREADSFQNALPHLGVPWTQFRPVQVEWMEDCRKTKGLATELYHGKMNEAIPPDYQVLAAQDILFCDKLMRDAFKKP